MPVMSNKMIRFRKVNGKEFITKWVSSSPENILSSHHVGLNTRLFRDLNKLHEYLNNFVKLLKGKNQA